MNDNGGPAFPQSLVDTGKGSGIVTANEMDVGGMTLRDYFAAKAMQGMLVATRQYEHGGNTYFKVPDMGIIGEAAYAIADVMLKERAK